MKKKHLDNGTSQKKIIVISRSLVATTRSTHTGSLSAVNMACAVCKFLYTMPLNSNFHLSSPTAILRLTNNNFNNRRLFLLRYRNRTALQLQIPKASSVNDGIASSEDDGVSLGTMKLPPDTDLQRFESLLFQWANSLCQGANLPLPVPLKVDKIPGGVRLGFITIGDGKTEVLVHIDCLVFPATDNSSPIFRAIRDGPLKDKSPPGEPRIMRSLQQALKKSVEIARV